MFSQRGTIARGANLTAMPRFYFDVHEGGSVSADEEGEECADEVGARSEATRALLEMGPQLISEANPMVTIEVRNDQGRKIGKSSLTLSVE